MAPATIELTPISRKAANDWLREGSPPVVGRATGVAVKEAVVLDDAKGDALLFGDAIGLGDEPKEPVSTS